MGFNCAVDLVEGVVGAEAVAVLVDQLQIGFCVLVAQAAPLRKEAVVAVGTGGQLVSRRKIWS